MPLKFANDLNSYDGVYRYFLVPTVPMLKSVIGLASSFADVAVVGRKKNLTRGTECCFDLRGVRIVTHAML